MKSALYSLTLFLILFLTLAATTPAQAHGGEGWILGVLTGGALTFFGIILVGIIAIAGLGLLCIFGYWVYLVYTRKAGNKILLVVSFLLVPALIVVMGFTSFIGTMWYKTLTRNGGKQDSVQEKNIEPPAQPPQPLPADNPP